MNKRVLFSIIIAVVLISSVAFATFESITVNPQAPTEASVQNAVETILGVAQWIGFIVGIAMIIWVGVKYLTAGAGTKAEVKSTMIPILVGAFLVALAPTVAHWLFNAFGGNGGGGSH